MPTAITPSSSDPTLAAYRCPIGRLTLAARGGALVGLWVAGQRFFGRPLVVDEAVAASAAPRGPAKGQGKAEGAQASPMVTIRVADDGPGIPPAIRDRVFDRFVRGDSSRTRDGRGSSGLGMSIVESLARAMGGSVRLVDSEKGTVIDVTLPAA